MSGGQDTDGLEKDESLNVVDILNKRLIHRMGAVDMRVLEWIANNSARKI